MEETIVASFMESEDYELIKKELESELELPEKVENKENENMNVLQELQNLNETQGVLNGEQQDVTAQFIEQAKQPVLTPIGSG